MQHFQLSMNKNVIPNRGKNLIEQYSTDFEARSENYRQLCGNCEATALKQPKDNSDKEFFLLSVTKPNQLKN